jgi:hypothetical protein
MKKLSSTYNPIKSGAYDYLLLYEEVANRLKKLDEEIRLRETKLLPLPKKAQDIHDKTYDYLLSNLGQFIKKRSVFIDPDLKDLGGLFTYPGKKLTDIIVNEPLGNLSQTFHHTTSFYNQNPSSAPEDLLRYTLVHEYAHILEGDSNRLNLYDSPFGNPQNYGLNGFTTLSEAFAYWFSDAFTGFKYFSEHLAQGYSHVADTYQMILLYETFSKCEKENDRNFVVENKEVIAKEAIKRITQ